jgi:hypothetical protein
MSWPAAGEKYTKHQHHDYDDCLEAFHELDYSAACHNWCILVHIGAYWCILVHIVAYCCILLQVPVYEVNSNNRLSKQPSNNQSPAAPPSCTYSTVHRTRNPTQHNTTQPNATESSYKTSPSPFLLNFPSCLPANPHQDEGNEEHECQPDAGISEAQT